MYVMKISKDKQLLAVRHYQYFENAVADISDSAVFDDIPDEIINEMGEWGVPKIYVASESEDGIADDFAFRYPCGIVIYVGKILCNDIKVRWYKCSYV